MRQFERIIAAGGLVVGALLLPGGQAAAVSSCSPVSGLPTTCTIDSASNNNALSAFGGTPFITGRTFDASSTYVLTVQNPLTTLWTTNGTTFTTANGTSSNIATSALVGQVGGVPTSSVGAFRISTMGALAVGGGVTGTANDGLGNSYNYTVGGALTLAIVDSDTINNSGTQTLTITKAPTVGGNVLANTNVFANVNSVGSEISTGLTLSASNTYTIAVTDPTHLWDNNIFRSDPTPSYWLTTANGITLMPDGTNPAPLCGPTANIWGITCGAPGSIGAGENPDGFYLGELVAMINGQYYGIGTSRTFTGLSGNLSLLYWDIGTGDNAGFMNASVFLVPAPEPGSLLLLGSGIAGLAWLRRRRSV